MEPFYGNDDWYRLYVAQGERVMHWHRCTAVEQHPHKVSGAWMFRGSRVPVAALFANLRDGASVERFLEWFPGVDPATVQAVLDFEAKALSADVLPGAASSASSPPA